MNEIDRIIQERLQEIIGETQVSLTNCLEEIVNPVNYRATVSYSVMNLMYRFMISRFPEFWDYLMSEMMQSESDPGSVKAVEEWLENMKPE